MKLGQDGYEFIDGKEGILDGDMQLGKITREEKRQGRERILAILDAIGTLVSQHQLVEQLNCHEAEVGVT